MGGEVSPQILPLAAPLFLAMQETNFFFAKILLKLGTVKSDLKVIVGNNLSKKVEKNK